MAKRRKRTKEPDQAPPDGLVCYGCGEAITHPRRYVSVLIDGYDYWVHWSGEHGDKCGWKAKERASAKRQGDARARGEDLTNPQRDDEEG